VGETSDWLWDPSLYSGSAAYYAQGRLPYPPRIANILQEALGLDGTGSYLDVGCGPGSLTLLLAPLFESAIGIDADPEMIRVAKTVSADVDWRCMRAEELPADLGPQRLITLAQSFHWFNRPLVAGIARRMIEPGGACVHVQARTHEGAEGSTAPRAEIGDLVARYLGTTQRAGQGLLPNGTPGKEDEIYRRAGFKGPERIDVARGEVFERTEDQIVASVFSLSSAAPHLFGDRLAEFEDELRELLKRASPSGLFHERAFDMVLDIWR
jgi:SAM-dependent methyltransferase